MLNNLSRRSLLKAGSGLALAAAFPLGACQSVMGAMGKDPNPISLAQWSLHRAFFDKRLDPLDFAQVSREEYGIGAIEYVNSFFKDKAKDLNYLSQLKQRASDHGVQSLLIMIDGEGDLGAHGADAAIENHKPWIDAAAFLGCHSIRVNARGSGTREQVSSVAAASLRSLAEYAQPAGLSILVENHGGYSSDGAWLAEVMRKADHPGVGTLPDFGNFRIDADHMYDRYRGVSELMPYAKAVSAKSHEFDDAGNEVHTDYVRMLKIVLDAGYGGYIGVEYEGSKHSESEGIHLTK
ncbi:MAG: sugar phosphate isomerase/epimerase, partial [Planctomycetes bacterium]|nr:sugar phosphate isomerase/epimerase [Planctomycetota bacterium]